MESETRGSRFVFLAFSEPSPVQTRTRSLSWPAQAGDALCLRAYELYEARGKEDGHELEDWLAAEEEITEKKVRTAAA